MDPIVLVVILVVGFPVGVVLALAYAARLRGPAPRKESRARVGSLVTDVVPEEHPEEADRNDGGAAFSIDSPPPDPDPELRDRSGP